jgi:hypothetical protein
MNHATLARSWRDVGADVGEASELNIVEFTADCSSGNVSALTPGMPEGMRGVEPRPDTNTNKSGRGARFTGRTARRGPVQPGASPCRFRRKLCGRPAQ